MPASPLDIVVHRRYNPDGISQYFIVPGLLGVILQMTMMMMTCVALTREIERGTMENLLAMPATGAEIMFGKVMPFFIVGAVQVTVILTAARYLFHVPFVGSLAFLLAGVLAFVLQMVLLGYTFSTLARSQMQAMQLTFFFLLPSILMSGFMFPFRGMPAWAQFIGDAAADDSFPARRARHHAEGRKFFRDRPRVPMALPVRAAVCNFGSAALPPHAGLGV